MEGVRRALAELGSDTQNKDIGKFLKSEFGIVMDTKMISNYKTHLKSAGKSGARFLVIAGEDEWARGEVALKDSKTGEQKAVRRESLAAELAARISHEETTT
jgi:histidyl-tRNA synthetase